MNEFSVSVLCLAGCVFAASAASKLRDRQAYRAFRAGLRQTALVPPGLLTATAAVLCAAELAIAAGLFTGAALTSAAFSAAGLVSGSALAAAGALTAVLAAGVAVVIRRGTSANCHCFGAGSGRPLGWVHLVRNLSLLAVICAGLATDLSGSGTPSAGGLVLAAGSGLVASLLIIKWDDLADLFLPIQGTGSAQRRTGQPADRHG